MNKNGLSSKSKLAVISELLFIFLPLFVISIVKLSDYSLKSIIFSSDWSFASIVLFGQSIVKFSSGISSNSNGYKWQAVAFIVAIIIVIGLIPSVVILVKTMEPERQNGIIYWFQFGYFFVSCFTFYFIGTTGQILLEKDEKNQT
jgi:hypothetical protein